MDVEAGYPGLIGTRGDKIPDVCPHEGRSADHSDIVCAFYGSEREPEGRDGFRK